MSVEVVAEEYDDFQVRLRIKINWELLTSAFAFLLHSKNSGQKSSRIVDQKNIFQQDNIVAFGKN